MATAAAIQIGIPDAYLQLSPAEWTERITAAKAALGERLLILGHHYQKDEVIQFADLTGDSFKLARLAAENRTAEYIVFCGVHFMAETADILTGDHQRVILPDLNAGCSMADMANPDEVEECWQLVQETFGDTTIPITYVNSAAVLKAFCGQRGGAVCTSSNARKILDWAFHNGDRVLFFPDEHLGRNTALAMGLADRELVVYNQRTASFEWLPGQSPEDVRVILWKGFCSVHQRFQPAQVQALRDQYPGIRVIVHPECNHDVVAAADQFGSTEYIISQIEAAPAGTVWAIGTEVNLVHRLAKQHPEQTILSLNPIVCPCTTMSRISPYHLTWALESLRRGEVVNQISVPNAIAVWAKRALDTMLTIA
ncbi:quinolinate synthase NadA [Alicyclobacillus contaminans]|uniref:quinolinate synthase NadA n=1 Tax=Alicyclobacillus contaminans TaxID=392016 RepID=UPI0003FEE684|nr:quinolinate synthase NadA [Alicyclobacillus contaminans]